MLIKHPAFAGVTVYIISRDALFSRMLELELCECGLNVIRAESFPSEEVGSSEMRVLTASSDALEADPDRFVQIEFGFSEDGSGRAERYFKRPFPVDDFARAVVSLALAAAGETRAQAVPSEADGEVACSASVGLIYDGENGVFSYDGEPLEFTETEFSLLSLLYERRGEAVTREELLSRVWGREGNVNARKTNLTDVYIKYLREKLDDRFDVRLILSVRGKGYMLR